MKTTYWEGKGKHQKEANYLEGFVPSMGASDNPYIEAFRWLANIYYDLYNNGGWNLHMPDLRWQWYSIRKLPIEIDPKLKSILDYWDDDDMILGGSSEFRAIVDPLENLADEIVMYAYENYKKDNS